MFGFRKSGETVRSAEVILPEDDTQEPDIAFDDFDIEEAAHGLRIAVQEHPPVSTSQTESIPFMLSSVPSHAILEDHGAMYKSALKDLRDAKGRLEALYKDTKERILKVTAAIEAANSALTVVDKALQTNSPTERQVDPGAASAEARARLAKQPRSAARGQPAAAANEEPAAGPMLPQADSQGG